MPQKSSDKQRAACRRYYHENREALNEKKRQKYAANPEKSREKSCAQSRRYRANNLEQDREYHKRWYVDNREKVLKDTRKNALRRQYGITFVEYAARNRDQNGLCLICKHPCQKLCVDHCHKSGVVRGLLCRKCNTGLGSFNDDFSTLIRAAHYIGWRSN